MSALADRIRAAREQWVTVEGKQFLLRRPTRLQLADLNGQPREVVFSSVVGWKLAELDLVPGGSGRVPEFDSEAFREYASDRIDLVNALAQELQRMIAAHSEAVEAAEKN